MNRFMKLAIEEAIKGVKADHGGPFGAVIVRDEDAVGIGHNTVVETNDPTAHAEINAIRMATKRLGRFDLSDCVIYSSCEPCPMCLGAIHWARMKRLYYGCTREDAEAIGFDDRLICDAMTGESGAEQVVAHSLDRTECLRVFRLWESKEDRVRY